MKKLLSTLIAGIILPAFCGGLLHPVAEYGIGNWPEKGRGNHRALVDVNSPAKAVRVKIPWRRTDSNPENKKIVVFAPDGTREIAKVHPVSVSPMWGDLVFEAPAAGVYSIYWLPYTPWENWNDPEGEYYKADYSAAKEWYQALNINSLPPARVVRIESRGEFNSFWPMQIPVMPDEMKKMKTDAGYAVFAEDRSLPVKMFDAIPVRWLENGPAKLFKGKAQPGEFYPFQIAVWSFGKELEADLQYSDLKSENGEVIPAASFECINIDITEFSGKKRHTPARVGPGKVQPLWVIARVPTETPPGTYRGECTVNIKGHADTVIPLEITVDGEVLEDGGVSDAYRLARLAWLNSTIGLDDTVPAPFRPIEFNGRNLKVAMGEAALGDSGLPEKISVNGHRILAGAPEFKLFGKGFNTVFQHNGVKITKEGNDRTEWQASGQNNDIKYRLDGAVESDGMFEYALSLTPERNITIDDLSLILPIDQQTAKYLIGLGIRGGKRTADVNWKWNPKNATNYVWLGDYNRGIQLHLMPGDDAWEPMQVTPSPEWSNGGQGGIMVREFPANVAIRAYSGRRTLRKGETITFRFRLTVTPCRKQTAERWNWRFRNWGTPGNMDMVFHGARGNPNINYPFSELPNLGEEIDKIKNRIIGGGLSYKANERISRESGYIESELRINFDPNAQGDPIALPYLNFQDRSAFGIAWMPGLKGIRLIAIKFDPSRTTFPFEISAANLNWKKGEKHRVGFSWNNDTSALWVDGRKVAEGKFKIADYFTKDQFENGDIAFTGMTHIGKVRAGKGSFQPGKPGPDIIRSANDLLWDSAGKNADKLEGGFRFEDEYVCLDGGKEKTPLKATIYFTVREMSVMAPELWALRSLPDNEIFSAQAFVYTPDGAWMAPEGTGYAWLREHLKKDYSPAWKTKTYSGERDFAIGLKAPTRWHNWYLAGADFLSKHYDINGIYLDSFGAGREVAKRLRKVLLANNPREGNLWWHAGNNFDFLNNGSSIYSTNMEAMPFYSQAWNGEAVDFNNGPDYYLIELSGIPFGLPAEMLEHHTGGHPFRGMVYGMSGRIHPSAKYMHQLWDQFDIANAEMIGYWNEKPVVELTNANMRATAYVHRGERTLIAIGDWPSETMPAARTAIAGRRTGPVKIDARLNDAPWANALVLKDFSILNSNSVSEKPTEAYVMWDENMLYFGFVCRGQDVSKLIAAKHRRDDKLWEDDSIELYLRPNYSSKDWIQFIGNSRGVFMDSRNSDPKWNGSWQYAARVENGSWCGEGAVAWRSLGIDGRKLVRDGGAIGFNFCRTMHLPNFEFNLWAQKPGISPANLNGFGKLILAEKAGGEVQNQGAVSSTGLKIDFEALGLDPARIKAYRPKIEHMQEAGPVDVSKPIDIVPGTGAIIILEARK